MIFLLEEQHKLRTDINKKILNLREKKKTLIETLNREVTFVNRINQELGVRKHIDNYDVHNQEYPKLNREKFTDSVTD